MKRGFILLEILIASLISSIISTGLLLTISQLNTAQNKLSDITSQYERAATAMQQLERDIMGAFIPLQAMPLPKPAESPTDNKEAAQQPKDNKEKSPASTDKKTATQAPPAQTKKQPNPIEKIFEGTEKNGQFDTLTFITDNPLGFMTAPNSKPKPRIVRVFYRLEQDAKRKNSFNLMWQEGTNLNSTAYTKDAKNELRPYTIIEGIAHMKLHYIMLDPEKNKDEKKKNQPIKKKVKKRKNRKKRCIKKSPNGNKKKMLRKKQ